MAEEVLSLSTIVKRSTIKIDTKRHPKGKLYELRNLADLGPLEYAKMLRLDARIQELRGLKKKLTQAQEREIDKMLSDSVQLVTFALEPVVLAAMTDEQKQMILVTWLTLIQNERAGAAEGNARPRSPRTTGS